MYRLSNGRLVPKIGFGTWEITPDSTAKAAVTTALGVGYRLIDTARIYGNEQGVGEAIRKTGIPREDLLITTKLWNDDQGYDRTLQACHDSLERLGLTYLDHYLIHWPASKKRHESWEAFERLQADGLVKAIGVSNYTVEHLQELDEHSGAKPVVDQVEFHPFIYEQQRPLLDYCKAQDILVEAYSPLSRIASNEHPVITTIAKKLDKRPQQVVLRWCIQHGTLPLPRSTNPDHIKSNFQVFDFELSDDDMLRLDNLSDGERVTWDPAGMGF